MILNVSRLCHQFGDKKVLHNINIKVSRGQFVALVGPSGCGKSTLFRSILGTHPPTSGSILRNGVEVNGPSRDIGVVYQQYSLYPFLKVEKNVAMGLKLDQTSIPYRVFRPLVWNRLRKQHLKASRELLEEVGLGAATKQYPRQLSGGMRQRVAIAQALIMHPSILLLDEPFSGLDEANREGLQELLLQLYQQNVKARLEGKAPPHTVIFITHELNEAFYLADRVIGVGQYWKALDEDGEEMLCGSGPEGLGATVMFDKAAPVYKPDDPRDFSRFLKLKETLRQVVFDENTLHDPYEHVTFWSDLAAGEATGISAIRTGENT